MNGALVRGSKAFFVTSIRGLVFITILPKGKKVRP